MFERFTDRARRTMVLAQEEARMSNHAAITSAHVLLGLIHEREGIAGQVLDSWGITLDEARRHFPAQPGPTPQGHIPFTVECKRVLELSLREALQLGHNYVGVEHILLGLMRDPEGLTIKIFKALSVEPETIRDLVLQAIMQPNPITNTTDSTAPFGPPRRPPRWNVHFPGPYSPGVLEIVEDGEGITTSAEYWLTDYDTAEAIATGQLVPWLAWAEENLKLRDKWVKSA